MNSVSSIRDLYDAFCYCNIPVLDENGRARPFNDILADMHRVWDTSEDGKRALMACAAAYMLDSEEVFNTGQRILLRYIGSENQETEDVPQDHSQWLEAIDDLLTGSRAEYLALKGGEST